MSVVIPTVGRITRLYLTLSALLHQTVRDVEIVVVDDSRDGLPVNRYLSALYARLNVEVVANGGRGVAAARNAGAAATSADLLVFVDDDTVLAPDALARHRAAHESGLATVTHGTVVDLTAFCFGADPVPAAGEEPVLTGLRGRRLAAHDLDDLAAAVVRFRPRRSVFELLVDSLFEQERLACLRWMGCVGTHTAVERRAFTRVGGFDASHGRKWGGEDLELGLRIAVSGGTFAILDTVGYHLATARRDADDAVRAFWRGVARRYREPILEHVGEVLAGAESADRLARVWPTVAPTLRDRITPRTSR